MNFFDELKRRNVFRVAVAFLVIGWLLAQVATTLEEALHMPAWFDTMVVSLLLLGFPLAVLFSWAFELTPEGIKREREVIRDASVTHVTAKKLDYITLAAAVCVAGLFGWQHFAPAGNRPASTASEPSTDTMEFAQKSIAVLPFVNMSSDAEQEYFSDGITEEILNALANLQQLKVVGRTSSFSFKGRNEDLRVIGEKLGVKHILEGSVRKQGQDVRITAQLILADNGFHLWSETYEGKLDDIFELQEKISRAIALELEVILDASDTPRLAKKLTDNPAAYDLFLQGRELAMTMYGQETLPKAVELFNRVIRLDPEFAEAWTWLAFSNFMLPQQVRVDNEEPYIKAAVTAALQSNKLDPTLSGGYSILGSNYFLQRDYVSGFEFIEKAYNIEPEATMNIFNQGFYLSAIGHTRKALPYLKEAVELDPVGGGWIHNYAITQMAAGELDAAEQTAQRSFDAGFGIAAMVVADARKLRGNQQAALNYLNNHYDQIKEYTVHFQSREVWELGLRALYTDDREAQQSVSAYLSDYLNLPTSRPDISTIGAFHLIGEPEKFMKVFEKYKFAGTSFILTRIWDDREESRKLRQHPYFPVFAENIGLLDVWKKLGWPDKCRPLEGSDDESRSFTCD